MKLFFKKFRWWLPKHIHTGIPILVDLSADLSLEWY